MTFTTPMEEAGIIVAELRDQVDVLIGLIHYGKDGEYGQQGAEEIASAYPQVDACMIGHAHESFAQVLDNGVAMMAPGADGSGVCKLTITLQKEGDGYEITEKVPELLKTADYEEDTGFLRAMYYVHQASVRDANTVIGRVTGDYLPSLEWKDLPGIPAIQLQCAGRCDRIL